MLFKLCWRDCQALETEIQGAWWEQIAFNKKPYLKLALSSIQNPTTDNKTYIIISKTSRADGCLKVDRFGPTVGPISPKWDNKSGTFSDQISKWH